MHSDVSDKLLHGVVFQVAVSSVHLESLVANLWGCGTKRKRENRKHRKHKTEEGKKPTLKHSSVAKSFAMEQRETASGLFSCSALAASRTSRRDATSLVAISASLNCRYCKACSG